MNISFNHQQFNQLFPFHIRINEWGNICGYGKTIQKMIGLKNEAAFFNYFSFVETTTAIDSYELMKQHLNELVVIDTKTDPSIQLRGQLIFTENNHEIIFMGSPSFTSLKEIEDRNLSVHDFAIQNPLIDLLLVLEKKEIEINKAKAELANSLKINEYNNRLRFALEKIGDNVWTHDFTKDITEFSHEKSEFLEYRLPNKSIAESWWLSIHPNDKWMLIKNDELYKKGKLAKKLKNNYRLMKKDIETFLIIAKRLFVPMILLVL